MAIKTSGTPRAELKRLYNRALVNNSLQAWQSLTKALEKEPEIMKMVMEIGPPSEAWRALSNIAADTEDDAYDRIRDPGDGGSRDCIRVFCTREHRSNKA